MTDGGCVAWLLGIKVTFDEDTGTVALNQGLTIDELVTQFKLNDANPLTTPLIPGTRLIRPHGPRTEECVHTMERLPYRSLVGGLMYFAMAMRPDLAFPVQRLAEHLEDYDETH